MKDVVLDEVMKNEIISKENFSRYFAQKKIITKEEYNIYFNKEIYEQKYWKFPDFFPT